MDKFICVFSINDKDLLLAQGYMLLKSDDNNSIYVFENSCENSVECFSLEGIDCVCTDTLTF